VAQIDELLDRKIAARTKMMAKYKKDKETIDAVIKDLQKNLKNAQACEAHYNTVLETPGELCEPLTGSLLGVPLGRLAWSDVRLQGSTGECTAEISLT
jgi:hypothetical protein